MTGGGFGRLALCAIGALLASGCGAPLPDPRTYLEPCALVTDPPAREAVARSIFFATTRLPDCRHERLRLATYRHPAESFGVSDLPTGEASWQRHDSRLLAEETWRETVTREIAAPGNSGRVLVYIHGYFNDYEDALGRAGILRDLYFDRVPTIAVSWPSRNRVPGYMYDEASVEWAQDYFDDLLMWLTDRATDITLVSHSMGGRALVRAVEHLDLAAPHKASRVRRIVLASPDIDRDQMLRENGAIDRLLTAKGRKIVVYTSRRDAANRLSRGVHGFARLGSSSCRFDVSYDRRRLGPKANCSRVRPRAELAVVETSNSLGPFHLVRHSDFVDSCAVRADLAAFLRGAPAPWRRLQSDGGLEGYSIDTADPTIKDCRIPEAPPAGPQP